MQKIVLGTREIIEYIGSCPTCKREQRSSSEQDVDVLCHSCLKKRKEDKTKEEYKYLIGGVITDVYGYNNLTMIKIKTSDNEEYQITSHREFSESDFESYLCIDKIEELEVCKNCGVGLKDQTQK